MTRLSRHICMVNLAWMPPPTWRAWFRPIIAWDADCYGDLVLWFGPIWISFRWTEPA